MSVVLYRRTWLLPLISGVCCAATVLPGEEPVPRASFAGFGFAIPAGWSRVTPDRDKTAAVLLLNGTTWQNADAMIKVDVGKPNASSLTALAKALAGPDGKVYAEPVSIDGVDGIKIETTSTDMSRPKYAIVLQRNEKAYLIMAAGKKGKLAGDPLEHVAKTWKWLPDQAEK